MTKYEYYECGVFVSVAYFWVNSAGCSGEFHVVFKYFENLENFIWTFLRKNCIFLDLWVLFSWKLCRNFRTARCKQPRLAKPCLNSDLHFIPKIFGTALLETIVSYKPLPSLSQVNRKTHLPALLDTSTT